VIVNYDRKNFIVQATGVGEVTRTKFGEALTDKKSDKKTDKIGDQGPIL
jgi:hypothetical protein